MAEGDQNYIDKLIKGFNPSEILFNKAQKNQYESNYKNEFHTFGLEDWVFSNDYAMEVLLRHFKTTSLKGFGVEALKEGITAAGAIMQYLNETRHNKLEHIFNKYFRADENYQVNEKGTGLVLAWQSQKK